MISLSENTSFLDAEKFAPGIFSSQTICDLALPNGQLNKEAVLIELIGEVLFRHWLFKDQLPSNLRKLLQCEGLAEVKNALEKNDLDCLNTFAQSREYLEDRIELFEKSDGIIALVDTIDKEALPIPFSLVKNSRRSGVWDTSETNTQEVGVWSDYQEEIDALLGSGVNCVKLGVPIGPYSELIDGRSLMLPIALAVARKEDPTLPKPIELLASGVVSNGRIESVEFVEQKLLLAKRMGARFVAIMEDPPKHSFAPKNKEKLTSFIARWKSRFGRVLPSILQSHFDSWHTHIANFRGREKLIKEILDRLLDKEKGGHAALISPEGMGKSALLSQVSKILNNEAKKSGRYKSARELCPWLPGCIIHMGKFGSDPHAVTESLLVQINSMISTPIGIPNRPIREEKTSNSSNELSENFTPINYREHFRLHREAIQKGLVELIKETGVAYLLIDALDEVTVEKGFLDIFPDPFPQHLRLLITGRNCHQVDKFLDRRSGFKRFQPQKLERFEIPEISGVSDEEKDGRIFNNKLYQKTGGWTYAVNETAKLIHENGGIFSDDLIRNREETLSRMAENWTGELLEDALEFLVMEEFFNCLKEKEDRSKKSKYYKDNYFFWADIASGDYQNSYYWSIGPRIPDLLSYLKTLGHKVNLRKLHKAMAPVREQLVFNTYQPKEYTSYSLFGLTGNIKTPLEEKTETLCFAVRIFPEYYLEKFIRDDFEDSLKKMCNWMVCSQDPETLWRLDFLIYRAKKLHPRLSKLHHSNQWKKIADACWAKITNSWEIDLIEDIRAGDQDYPPSLWTDAHEEVANHGTNDRIKFEVASAYAGFWLYCDMLRIESKPERGIKMLEEILESGGSHASEAALYLACNELGFDPSDPRAFEEARFLTPSINREGKDAFKALTLLEQAIELGNTEAELTLGTMYLNNDLPFYNATKGIEILEKLSDRKTSKTPEHEGRKNCANEVLAWHYINKDYAIGLSYFKRAIKGGNHYLGEELVDRFSKSFYLKETKQPQEHEKFFTDILIASLEGICCSTKNEKVLVESLKRLLVNALVIPEMRLHNNRIDSFLGLFEGWNFQREAVFQGVNSWIYVQDYAAFDYAKNPSKSKSYNFAESFGFNYEEFLKPNFSKETLRFYKDQSGDEDLEEISSIKYLPILSVSETIQLREVGKRYRDLSHVGEYTKTALQSWYEKNKIKGNKVVIKSVGELVEAFELNQQQPSKKFNKKINKLQNGYKSQTLTKENEIKRLFFANGPVAVLKVIEWLDWEVSQDPESWQKADKALIDLAASGFRFRDDLRIPWYNLPNYKHPFKSYLTEEFSKEAKWVPDYNWLAREGHPLHDLSIGMLVRHGIYEDPDGFPPKQRFDLARKGNIAIPDWMNELETKKK